MDVRARPIPLVDGCCAIHETLDGPEAERLAAVFGALADPTRVRLVSLLANAPEQEACVCELVAGVGLSQPTVSHHLKVLHAAGLLDREKRGTWAYYRLRRSGLRALRRVLGGG